MEPSNRINGKPFENVRKFLLDNRHIAIPLKGKRPLVKWGHLIDKPPSLKTVLGWWREFPNADVGVLTTIHGNIICLDCDKPPYPEGMYYETPSGGRHYWYEQHPDDEHGINVSDGHDIPWIVRAYHCPMLNPGRIPEQPSISVTRAEVSTWVKPDDPPLMENLTKCKFINWFQEKRLDESWEGRYALARCYASNVAPISEDEEDRSLGNNYRHADDIYERLAKPITCGQIVAQGYPCPNYHEFSDSCLLAAGIRTPFGLAIRLTSTKNNDKS